MTNTEKSAFKALMLDMARLHPREDMGEEVLRVYWRALSDCELEDVSRAVHVLERTSKWLPKPSGIHAEMSRYRMANRDTSGPEAEPYVPSPAEIDAQRTRERADPAVRVAATLKAAWAERQEAVAGGMSLDDAAAGFELVLRDVLPCRAHYRCDDCRDMGLVTFRQAGYSIDRPCSCPAGDKFKAMAKAADDARRWIVKRALEQVA